MAIEIKDLKKISEEYTAKDFIYKDLNLDFELQGEYSSALEKKLNKNDVKVSYDESAIRNSLRNLFNTKQGQRFLFPLYGLDFYEFLFEPCTDYNGQTLGEKIVTAIRTFEPRVKVNKVTVVADPEQNSYYIDIIVQMPELNTTATFNTQLDLKQQTFIFVQTSRNR
jgi:phage baseplate assembly protein W